MLQKKNDTCSETKPEFETLEEAIERWSVKFKNFRQID